MQTIPDGGIAALDESAVLTRKATVAPAANALEDAVIDIMATAGMLHEAAIAANATGCRNQFRMQTLTGRTRMVMESIGRLLKAVGEQP